VASVILLALTPVVYGLIEHRLHTEFGRELRIDWDLVEGHLEADSSGRIRWRAEGTAPGDPAHAALWFEVWSDTNELLLRHWPVPENQIKKPLPPPQGQNESFYTVNLDGLEARAIEKPARIGGRSVILRVFRDESGLHRTLREILIGFTLGVPLAAVLAALGGYVMAGRTLAPVSAMAEQARQITSESLSQRLPNPNPHDELGQMAAVFNQTLQRLQDSFEALRRFTADASHELRTPLTALRAVGEVSLRDSSDAPALRETIGSMLEEAQRLNDLIDSLLQLARVESGRAPLHLEPVRLDELLSEIRESVGVLAAEKQQTIETAGEPGVTAIADRRLTGQALMNILHNAIRYSRAGSTVRVQSFRRDDRAVIEIADEGPGIAAEHHQKIFERFFRLDNARSRSGGGAGLGLAIARLSVEQQHGTIELDSALGKGSRFRIVLPTLKKS
jgi:heavy metal sensor kinase